MGYAADNIEGRRANQKRYYERHKEAIRERKRLSMCKYRETEKGRKSNAESVTKFYKANPEIANANTQKRIAAVKRATPSWLSEAQRDEMKAFYDESAEMRAAGNGMTVDHIVPIRGLIVSGLHVP